MDTNEFTYGRDYSAPINPARARVLGSSGLSPYVEDMARRIYKHSVLGMCGDAAELDDVIRGIAIQNTADILNSRLRCAKTEGGTPITTEQVGRVVERLRLPDSTIKPSQPVQLTREAYEVVEEEYLTSGGNMKDIASYFIMVGQAAVAQGFNIGEDFPPH